jgi:hypothetical protein
MRALTAIKLARALAARDMTAHSTTPPRSRALL